MSNGFSWEKILGGAGENTEAAAPPAPKAPVDDPSITADLPFGGFNAENGFDATAAPADGSANDELKNILSQLKGGGSSEATAPPVLSAKDAELPEAELPEFHTPKFEDIAPAGVEAFNLEEESLVAEVASTETVELAPPTRPVFEEEAPAAKIEEEVVAETKNVPFDPAILTMEIGDASLVNSASSKVEKRQLGSMRLASENFESVEQLHVDEILRVAVERRASDIHFTTGLPPMSRIDGEINPLPYQPLSPQQCQRLVYEIMNDERLEKFETTHELDFSYAVRDVGRFRVNVYMQRGVVASAMRAIPTKIPDFASLGLPNVVREMSKRTSGLVLVTGPTGSGKSTTIATMIDDINASRKSHIITIEDPIEYLHSHKQCMINQREMHSDTYSFHNSLRAILREDPDIILVGELRDLETIEAALTLAETGHLVFATLHTRNAPSTIDRIIDVFPKESQAQIRVLLSNTLEGVISQQLLPKIGGGRVAAIEIMIATAAIKNLIREGKTHQMYSSIETSGNVGMQTMDATLAELYRGGRCDWEECVIRAIDKETFSRLAKRAA